MRSSLRSPTAGLRPIDHVDPVDHVDADDQIGPGDEIEIWCRSLGTWSSGFVAVDLGRGGWRVLRRSDRTQLPVRFPDTQVRRPAAAPSSRQTAS